MSYEYPKKKLLTLQYMNKKLIQNKSMLVFKD